MAILRLNWDGSVPTTLNSLAFRASKRIKTVGLPWITTGFSPANDMALSIFTTDATVTANKVYEFKLEVICTSGGPTANPNGIQENIAFQCIVPSLSSDATNISVSVNLAGTDITKVRFVLKRQSDNFIVGGPVIENNVADAALHTFTGLTPNIGYYVTLELYATINGIDTISSSSGYMNAVCGGNISGYQISTTTGCISYTLTKTSGTPSAHYTSCSNVVTDTLINTATVICTDGHGFTISGGGVTLDSSTVGAC